MRVFFCCCAFLVAALASAQRTVTITDYTGRGFAPDLVHYTVKLTPAAMKTARLFRDGETPVALQFGARGKDGAATMSFVADVPPYGTSRYTLAAGGAAPTGSLTAAQRGDTIELATALLAVRLPKGAKTFKAPVPARTLPAPILAFRSGGPGAAWLGGSAVLTDRPVKAWKAALVEQGPVSATAQYEITYAGGGYYRSTITVIDGVPVVKVRDEYDLGSVSPTDDLWELCLTDGWEPDMAETAQTWGNGTVRGSNIGAVQAVWMGTRIQPYGALGDEMSQIGLSRAREATDTPADSPMVGVVPLHHGNWRRIQQLPVVYPPDRGRIAVRFPMTRSNPRADLNPFFAGTHDDRLPVSYARREWALALGRPALEVKANWGTDAVGPFYQLRLLYGVIGLDRYKDYVTDWPDTDADYPRVFLRKRELPKIREALAKNPALFDPFKDHYYFRDIAHFYSLTGDPTAIKKPHSWPQQLQAYLRYLVSCPTPSHHMTFELFSMLPKIEDTLACPALLPEDRRKLRAQLAVLAYELCEPDAMGHANGAHTGNPNMSIARQMCALNVVALLPDHPMYAQWRDFLSEYMTYKMATMMTPGGAWFEPGGYQMWAYGRMITAMSGVETMRPTQTETLYAYHRSGMDYLLNQLTPPDPRYGARMHPGFGNSSANYFENYFDAAMTFADHDPAFAGELLWAWQVNGQSPFEMSATYKPWVQPREPRLASRGFPGFGVIFRAHQGPDETYLLLRSGYDWSHWYVDQGNCALYSKGASLLPCQPYAYYDNSPHPDYALYNLARFGETTAQYPYGWPDSNVLDSTFGPRAQYAWASAGYPAGDPRDEYGWERQVAFLIGKTAKSPNYFVFHDTFHGKALPNWLYSTCWAARTMSR
ncbi:MAG TPA: hypothetical protein PLZ36_08345 [Armatimonadota bacterium]|nr:hypothetical protein [Armatimonadota bacterium]